MLSNANEPLPLGELARRTDTGSSSAHRYIQSLVKEELAVQDPDSGRYDLGPAALSIGLAALQRLEPVDIAASHAKQLASQYRINAGIAIWTERGPTLIRWYRRANFMIGSIGLGDVLPLDNTATGLMFQAYLPEAKIAEVRKIQAPYYDGAPPAKKLLAQVKSECFAELKGHLYHEIAGQAVPVFDAQQELVCVMATVTNLAGLREMHEREALYKQALLVAKETGGLAAFEGTKVY